MENYELEKLIAENEELRTKLERHEKANTEKWELRWLVARKSSNVLLGKDLKVSVKHALTEVSETKTLSKDTLADLIAHTFWRFTRVGIFMIFLTILPTCFLAIQTILLHNQNKRIDVQNSIVENQNLQLINQTCIMQEIGESQNELLSTQNVQIEKQTNLMSVIEQRNFEMWIERPFR